MEKWEYLAAQIAYFNSNDGWGYVILDDKGVRTGNGAYLVYGLNQLGADGWELAGVLEAAMSARPDTPGGSPVLSTQGPPVLLFKRRKP